MEIETHASVWADDPRAARLSTWLIQQGVLGNPPLETLQAYCEELVSLGVPLMRAHITMNALHPVYGGVGFNWKDGQGPLRQQYEHVEEVPDEWLQSPFHFMLTNDIMEYRERICDSLAPSRFPMINELKGEGGTDYLAAGRAFIEVENGRVYSPDDRREGALMSWTARGEGGFTDADLALIRATFPTLCLVLKSGSNRQTAEELLGVYLGRDAGRRVLSGEIQRGSSRWIDAVICYFDLEGFTSMSRRIEGEALIALLNDYFGLVVDQIEGEGGNVLKFMGDGLLAIFDREQFADAAARALRSTAALEAGMAAGSARRAEAGLPTLDYTIALHAGRVLYGNIGGNERLDFTVIGPEVNLAARLGGMHRPLGQPVIVSETVARDVPNSDFDLVSLGRYMLRGVEQPQELFTLYKG